eukprot:SAG22_NODE_1945_length_3279_cov_1.768239_2_plen_107_part_00
MSCLLNAVPTWRPGERTTQGPNPEALIETVGPRAATAVSCKALHFCRASTVFLSKTAPFRAVPLGQGYPPIVARELAAAHYRAAYGAESDGDRNQALRALGEKLVD